MCPLRLHCDITIKSLTSPYNNTRQWKLYQFVISILFINNKNIIIIIKSSNVFFFFCESYYRVHIRLLSVSVISTFKKIKIIFKTSCIFSQDINKLISSIKKQIWMFQLFLTVPIYLNLSSKIISINKKICKKKRIRRDSTTLSRYLKWLLAPPLKTIL